MGGEVVHQSQLLVNMFPVLLQDTGQPVRLRFSGVPDTGVKPSAAGSTTAALTCSTGLLVTVLQAATGLLRWVPGGRVFLDWVGASSVAVESDPERNVFHFACQIIVEELWRNPLHYYKSRQPPEEGAEDTGEPLSTRGLAHSWCPGSQRHKLRLVGKGEVSRTC